MVRWVVGSILHGVDPLTYFSFQGARCSSVVKAFAHGAKNTDSIVKLLYRIEYLHVGIT